jgi:hypothetical protein
MKNRNNIDTMDNEKLKPVAGSKAEDSSSKTTSANPQTAKGETSPERAAVVTDARIKLFNMNPRLRGGGMRG